MDKEDTMKASTIVPLFSLTLLILLALPFAVAAQDGLTEYSPEAIMEYRWVAMGQFYADQGMLTDDPDAVMAARWLAIMRSMISLSGRKPITKKPRHVRNFAGWQWPSTMPIMVC